MFTTWINKQTKEVKKMEQTQNTEKNWVEFLKELKAKVKNLDDAYIPSEYHNLEKVPLIFIKRDIKRYFEEEGLKQHLPYGFGNEIVIRLTKTTGGKYMLKKGRLKIDELAPFPQWTISDVNTKVPNNMIIKK